MGSQGGTCVQLHTSSMRWGLRGVPVQLHTSSERSMRWGIGGGYLCATSHIIYEMGSQGGTCMRWGLRGYLCATSHIIHEMGSQGVLVSNFTHHPSSAHSSDDDGVGGGVVWCEASHQTAEFFAHTQTGLRALDVDMSA